MYEISSDDLNVLLLDPVADEKRFGTRYCTGGYVFQIVDRHTGTELLTGPTFPDEFHPVHGQGIPDTFNHRPLYLRRENSFLILGIGMCDLREDRIVSLCDWTVAEKSNSSIVFTTRHEFNEYSLQITRNVNVKGRTVESHTRVENRGTTYVPLSWYPHPFFPPREDNLLFSVPPSAYMDLPTGYFAVSDGMVRRNPGVGQDRSFQPLVVGSEQNLAAVIHTGLGYECRMSTDYHSHFAPIWANEKTCSIEPYYDDTVFPGRSLSWTVRYAFEFEANRPES